MGQVLGRFAQALPLLLRFLLKEGEGLLERLVRRHHVRRGHDHTAGLTVDDEGDIGHGRFGEEDSGKGSEREAGHLRTPKASSCG